MLAQERGVYEGALQGLTKCNLVIACIFITEGAKLVQQMEDACWKKEELDLQTFALEANPHKYSYLIVSARVGEEGGEREKKLYRGDAFHQEKKKRGYIHKNEKN